MDTLKTVGALLADEGMYCLWNRRASDGKIIQKFYASLSVAMQAAYQFDENGFDSYFAMATFNDGKSRKVDNIKYMKSFFLDLDCGDKKEYPDQKSAIDALRKFCDKLCLPKPIIINSGRGVHVYWRFTENITYDEWVVPAERLKRACLEHGFANDVAVPADGARVLRVPNTHNYKDTPPKEVTVLGTSFPAPVDFDKFCELLGTDKIPLPVKRVSDPVSSALMDALSGNTQGRFKTILDKTFAGKGCKQLEIIISDQKDMSEPMWRAGLSIAKYCVDGEKAAKIISSRYDGYDEDETRNKLDLIKGPYLCARFNEYDGVSAKAADFKKIKSPIVLGREVIEADEEDNVVDIVPEVIEGTLEPSSDIVTIPTYPKPYFRGKTGGVYMRVLDKDGDPMDALIYENDFYIVGRLRDPELGECAVLRLHLPHDPMREFNVPLFALTSRDEFRKAVSAQGIMALNNELENLMVYVQTWVKELQQASSAAAAHIQFGWANDNKSFILGDKEYTHDSVVINHPSTATEQFFPPMKPRGTLEGWKKMINFYNRDGLESHQFVVCAGFGSPLMEFMPNITAAGLHVHHKDSGLGKTTAMLAACTIWGHHQGLVLSDTGTSNYQFNRVEIYKNLPLFIDEITKGDPKILSAWVHSMTGAEGKQKGRMSGGSNKERLRGDPWSFIALSTGNTSILEKISEYKALPAAEAQRMMEFHAEAYVFDSVKETVEFNSQINENCGHAGPIFVQYIMKNTSQVVELLQTIKSKVDEHLGLTHENRFWSALITCALAGALIAKHLGLIEYDYDKLFKFAGRLVDENKNALNVVDKGCEEHLVDFMNEHYSNILHISGNDLGNTGLASLLPTSSIKGQLSGRYETDTHKLFIVPKVLKRWCIKQQLNYSGFVTEMKEGMGATMKSARLYKGTDLKLPPTRVIVMDFTYDKDTNKS